MATNEQPNLESVNGAQQTFEENVDMLLEKRPSAREYGYTNICKELKSNYVPQLLEKSSATIVEAISKSLKKGTAQEQILASQTVPIVTTTLGVESEDVQKETAPLLYDLVVNSENKEVREAAIESLGLTCFVSNMDEKSTLTYMEIFSKIFTDSKLPSDTRVVALDYWGLLLTTISTNHVYDVLIPDFLAPIVEMLKSEDVDLRLEAGETLGLLLEVAMAYEGEDYKLENYNGYIETDDLLDTLYELSQDRTKTRAKKDKIKQRVPFKEITSFVESGTKPSETVTIRHQKFTFNTWASIKQLNSLRECLGTGFQNHFENNDLLYDIFSVDFDKEAKKQNLSAIEKRMMFSPNSPHSKARTKALHKQRSQRETVVDSILVEDD